MIEPMKRSVRRRPDLNQTAFRIVREATEEGDGRRDREHSKKGGAPASAPPEPTSRDYGRGQRQQ
jgi:hypothetical protein